MFPLDYDDERLSEKKYFTIRHNDKNYFPNSIPIDVFIYDEIKIYFHKNIAAILNNEDINNMSSIIRSEIICVSNDNNDKYYFKSINDDNLHLDITNLNIAFYNGTNKKINGEMIFSFLLEEKNIEIEQNELLSIIMEDINTIKINSSYQYNINNDDDIMNIIIPV
jgi:hypothetical protein